MNNFESKAPGFEQEAPRIEIPVPQAPMPEVSAQPVQEVVLPEMLTQMAPISDVPAPVASTQLSLDVPVVLAHGRKSGGTISDYAAIAHHIQNWGQ